MSLVCRGERAPDPYSIQRRMWLLYTEVRLSLCICRGGRLLLDADEIVHSVHGEESVPLLSVEEAASFSMLRREWLLSTKDRVPLCYL